MKRYQKRFRREMNKQKVFQSISKLRSQFEAFTDGDTSLRPTIIESYDKIQEAMRGVRNKVASTMRPF